MSEATVDNIWTLGWRLQWSARHAHMSRDEMADEMGVAPSTISRWFRDGVKKPPNKLQLARWAYVTGVTLDFLMGKSSSPFLPDAGDGSCMNSVAMSFSAA